jgi:hypothetical protein
MIRRMGPVAAAVVMVLSSGIAAAPAQAGVMDFLFGGSSAKQADASQPSSKKREWSIGEFTAVRLQPQEPGAAPNAHPATLPVDWVKQALGSITITVNNREERLLDSDEVADLALPISQAFSLARPQDDVLLLSTSKRDAGILGTAYGVTARLFVQDGALQFIVHDTRLDFVHAYRGSRIVPDFVFGSRNQQSKAMLKTSAGSQARPDWVAFRLGAPAVAAAPAPAAAPAAPAAAPVVAPAAPAAVPAPATGARDARFFEEQEQRLRTLKRLRDQNLITEEEYQQKRREILQTL